MLEKGWIYNMIKEIKTKLSSFEIFTIFRNEENSFILDSAMDKKKLGRFSFISSNPFKVLKYKNTLLGLSCRTIPMCLGNISFH